MKRVLSLLLCFSVLFAGCTSVPELNISFSEKSKLFLNEYNLEIAINLSDEYKEYINEIYALTQKYRDENNEELLEFDEQLTAIAFIRANEIADTNKFSHHRPNGEYFSSLHKSYGYTAGKVGENLARNLKTPDEAFDGWKQSKTHNANMLKSEWTKIGIGIAETQDRNIIWVQEFM